MRKLLASLLLIVSFSGTSFANTEIAANNDPSAYLEKLAKNLIAELEINKHALKKDISVAEKLVNKHILPAIDTLSFSKRTLGKKIWTSMSESQRATFEKAFIGQVINKYAKGLSFYDGQDFVFKATRFNKKKTAAEVKSSMLQSGSTPLQIVYHLSNSTGKWLITNFIVEGVNMRNSYKNQFRPRIKEIGLEQFLQELTKPKADKKLAKK